MMRVVERSERGIHSRGGVPPALPARKTASYKGYCFGEIRERDLEKWREDVYNEVKPMMPQGTQWRAKEKIESPEEPNILT